MKRLLPIIAVAVLAGCAHQIPSQFLSDSKGAASSVVLPDGHSTESYLISGTCADPDCVSQLMVAEGVHTYYDANGRLISVPHDLRISVSPSFGMAAASITIPAIIGSAGTIAAGRVLGESIRPNMLSITDTGSSAVASATGGASSSVSSAMGGAGGNATASATQTQTQMQHQHLGVEAINPGIISR